MSVSFKYGEYLLSGRDAKDYSIIKTAQGLVRIKRFLSAEQAAISRLADLGFSAAQATDIATKELILASYAKSSVESASRWGQFLETVLPELEQEGWLVEFRDTFLLNFQSIDNWDAEISDSQNDWFEMRFNIEVEGQALPLLPLIMPVLENYDLHNLPETLNIPSQRLPLFDDSQRKNQALPGGLVGAFWQQHLRQKWRVKNIPFQCGKPCGDGNPQLRPVFDQGWRRT